MAISPELRIFAHELSRILGWIYFFAWSLSFYPQALMNYRRRSTAGLTVDYPTANILGYIAYSISTGAFLFSPLIRDQYAARHQPTTAAETVNRMPTVRINDFVFAFHALILSIITYSQFYPSLWKFEAVSEKWRKASRGTLVSMWIGITGVAVVFCLTVFTGNPWDATEGWAWIDVVYAVSYVKLYVTTIKYIPQAWANYKRKNTVGWAMGQNWCDFTGSILSLSQMVIDSSLEPDWSGLFGNTAKLGLGGISLFFDCIFIAQHCLLYRANNRKILAAEKAAEREAMTIHAVGETTPLLGHEWKQKLLSENDVPV